MFWARLLCVVWAWLLLKLNAAAQVTRTEVSDSSGLFQALKRPGDLEIQLTGNVTLSPEDWTTNATWPHNVGDRTVTIVGKGRETTIDLSQLPLVLNVDSDGVLVLRDLRIINSTHGPDADFYVLQETYPDLLLLALLGLWPSVTGVVGSKFVFENVVQGNWIENCTYQAVNKYVQQLRQVSLDANINPDNRSILIQPRYPFNPPVQTSYDQNSTVGTYVLWTEKFTFECQSELPELPATTSPSSSGTSTGVIVGATVGAVVGALALISVGWLLYHGKRRHCEDVPDVKASRDDLETGAQFDGNVKLDAAKGSDFVVHAGSSADKKGTSGAGFGSDNSGTNASVVSATMRARQGWQLPIEGVELAEQIGRGAFGRVYKGTWMGAPVALKVIEHVERKQAAIQRETALCTTISHPNVVTTYKVVTVDAGQLPEATRPEEGQRMKETWMLLEFCDRGSLQDALLLTDKQLWLTADGSTDLTKVYETLLEIAQGLEFLHSENIIHGDLKAANVLLKSTLQTARGYSCKLADFGMSRVLDRQTHLYTRTCGTISHTPPEVLEHRKLTKAADVYAFGMLMWELYTGGTPYSGMKEGHVYMKVVHERYRPPLPEGCPQGYVDLVEEAMAYEAADRPTIKELVEKIGTLHKEAKGIGAATETKSQHPTPLVPPGNAQAPQVADSATSRESVTE